MRASVQIAKVRGIPLRVHVSFLVILPLLAALFAAGLGRAARAAEIPPEQLVGPAWAWGLGIAVALFGTVLLHELAHALYAVHTGGRVRAITLLMIGGVSELEETPPRPGNEAVMAFVGPLVSLVLGALLFGVAALLGGGGNFNLRFAVVTLASLNVLVGLFNLLPAFPMDGGRILRAALTPGLGLERATRIAATVGKVLAVLLGVLGLFGPNLLLILVAAFVFMGAEGEWRQVQLKQSLGALRIRDLMGPVGAPLHPDDSVAYAAAELARRRVMALPVERDGNLMGTISAATLRGLPGAAREGARVSEHLGPAATVSASEPAFRAVELFAREGVPQVYVVEEGRLVGAVDPADVERTVLLRSRTVRPRRREA